MGSIASYIDLINIFVATIAVALSLLAIVKASRHQRRDAFFRVQEMLLSPDLQEGRRLIYEATRAGKLPADEVKFNLIIRALAIFNSVAVFAGRGLVPRDWILADRHHALQDLRVAYDSILAYRQATWHAELRWPELGRLIDAAERYRSRTGCCDASPIPSGRRLLRRAGDSQLDVDAFRQGQAS